MIYLKERNATIFFFLMCWKLSSVPLENFNKTTPAVSLSETTWNVFKFT